MSALPRATREHEVSRGFWLVSDSGWAIPSTSPSIHLLLGGEEAGRKKSQGIKPLRRQGFTLVWHIVYFLFSCQMRVFQSREVLEQEGGQKAKVSGDLLFQAHEGELWDNSQKVPSSQMSKYFEVVVLCCCFCPSPTHVRALPSL